MEMLMLEDTKCERVHVLVLFLSCLSLNGICSSGCVTARETCLRLSTFHCEASGLPLRLRKTTPGHLPKEMIVEKCFVSTKHKQKLVSTQGAEIEDHAKHTSHEYPPPSVRHAHKNVPRKY